MAIPNLILHFMPRIPNSLHTCHALTLDDAISQTFLAELPAVSPENTLYWVVAFGSLGVALHNHYFDAGCLPEDLGTVRAAALRTASSIAHTLSAEILLKRQDIEPEHDLWKEAQSLRHVHLLIIEAPSNCDGIQVNLMFSLNEIKKSGTSKSIRRHVETDSGIFIQASIKVRPISIEPSLNILN